MTTHTTSGVLILDGDEIHAKTLVKKLQDHGVPADYASHPDEGAEKLKSDLYEVLLCEASIKGKSGLEFAQRVREERIAKPEIIIMSSDTKISLYDCHQVGACYLLRKPINMDELGLALKRFGNIHQMSAESSQDSVAALGRLYGQIRVTKNKQEFPVEVSNLGRGGFFCKTSNHAAPPPVGQVVDFNLKLAMVPNCECTGRGIIRWNHQTLLGDTGVGIEFLKIPDWFNQVAYSFADLFKVTSFIPRN